MYDVLMTLFVTAFFVLVAARMWLNYRRRVRRSMVPQAIAKRLAMQTARRERWAQKKAEEEKQHLLGKRVKRILDPYWNLDVRVRAEEQKLGRRIRIHPLVSDEGLTHR